MFPFGTPMKQQIEKTNLLEQFWQNFFKCWPLTRPLKKCFEISHDAPSKHPIENKERVWRSNFNSNMTSFFRRFVNKRAIYRLGIISLAHAPVHVTDFLVVNVHVYELSSTRIWQHKLCATLSANVNINYHLPIKVYNRICTLRHIRIEMINGSQNVFWVLTCVGLY